MSNEHKNWKHQCKYCNSTTSRADDMCWHCAEKVALWRKIQAMVRNKKEEIERNVQNESED